MATTTVSAPHEDCTPATITVSRDFDPSLPSPYLTATEAVREDSNSFLYNNMVSLSERKPPDSSHMTSTTRITYSTMSVVGVVEMASSTLSTTALPTVLSTVSTLATSSPIATGRCIPTPLPPALDYHVFHPMIDLSFENSTHSSGSTTVINPHDPNAENCAPYTVIYLPDKEANTCVRMTGEWTPKYSNVYYECIARVRAPDFDPANYLQSTTGLNFTSNDGSYSMMTSRTIGRKPERKYKQSSMMLFAKDQKSFNVEFWACGPGTTLFISELSCTYYD